MSGIETRAAKAITLADGRAATVKKLGRSKIEACMAASRFTGEEDDTGGKIMFAQYVTRAALTDVQEGDGFKFTTQKVVGLGDVASEDVYDSLESSDVAAIVGFAIGSVGEQAAKNSEPPRV